LQHNFGEYVNGKDFLNIAYSTLLKKIFKYEKKLSESARVPYSEKGDHLLEEEISHIVRQMETIGYELLRKGIIDNETYKIIRETASFAGSITSDRDLKILYAFYIYIAREFLLPRGEEDIAIECLGKVPQTHKEYKEAQIQIGCYYRAKGDFQQAQKHFRNIGDEEGIQLCQKRIKGITSFGITPSTGPVSHDVSLP